MAPTKEGSPPPRRAPTPPSGASSDPAAARIAVIAWEADTLGPALQRSPERAERFVTTSSTEIGRLYSPADLPGWDWRDKLGLPGQFPHTRSIHATGYRGRLWTMRQFAGFGSPADTNARFHYLLAQGQTGLSTAFDLPTLYGRDSDHPLALGEVGVCGVAIDTQADMDTLFAGLPLGEVTTSMTINAPAAVVWAMYLNTCKAAQVPLTAAGGTIQNDILKEFIAQKEWLFPPARHMQLIADTIEYGTRHVPRWNTISISGYHIREAGSTALQELAFTLADGMAYVDAGIARGLPVDEFAPRLSFFFNAHNDLFEEIAKYRAARRIWAHLMRDRYGAKDPRSLLLRFHSQTAGCSLTVQQPEVNIVRVAVQALAAVLGGTQSLHTNSMDEAWALPTEKAVRIALRTQQVLAHESGVANTIDPLGGAYFVEWLTDQMEEGALRYFDRIAALGGVVPAIEKGFFQREIHESAVRYQREIDTKERTIVGVNDYVTAEEEGINYLRISPQVETDKVAALRAFRRGRDGPAVAAQLDLLRRHADAVQPPNLMPTFMSATAAGVTMGEICSLLEELWGGWDEPLIY